MYFGIAGTVTMCCYNQKEKLGFYSPGDKLSDIWHSRAAKNLRSQFSNSTMSAGCERCAHELQGGNYEGLLALKYDASATPVKLQPFSGRGLWELITGPKKDMKATEPDYPEVMEFEIANTCNLECIMCNEACSSAIRSRKGLPPVLGKFDIGFVEQLREFIPHLKTAHFFGGEPFLIDLYYDIWDLIIELKPTVVSHITSNGTILNSRVREILESHPVNLCLSIDAITKEVYEKIRVNAKYDRMVSNLDYFISIKDKLDHLSITACAMPTNRLDLPLLVEFCNQNDIGVFFNTVFEPFNHSMSSLTVDELKATLDYYENFSFKSSQRPKNEERFKGLVKQTRYWYEQKLQRVKST